MTPMVPPLPSTEYRTIWVYALNMSDAERAALFDDTPVENGPQPLPAALGLEFIDTDFLDLVSDAELRAMPLSQLLVEGHGMEPELVQPDAAKLDALSGWVLLVHGRALGAAAPSETPKAPIAYIGRYAETLEFGASDMGHVETAQASDVAPKARKTPSDAAMSGRVAMIALLVMAFLVWLMIWVAG